MIDVISVKCFVNLFSNINMNFHSCTELEIDIKMGKSNAQTNSEHAYDEAHSRGGSIDAFFANAVILLTGATGFLGKALLEKLLRSCPGVTTIFILIRPKKDQSVEQRFKHLLDNPVRIYYIYARLCAHIYLMLSYS